MILIIRFNLKLKAIPMIIICQFLLCIVSVVKQLLASTLKSN